jgi:hypothetical protein
MAVKGEGLLSDLSTIVKRCTLVFGKANPSPKSSSSSRFTRDSLGISSLPGQMSRNVNHTIHGKKAGSVNYC